MKFLLLFGPPAVGKMMVGHELEKITGFKLFHNHMTIDMITPVFEFGTPRFNRLLRLFRNETFKEAATSDLKGLIFTFMWVLNEKSDEAYVNEVVKIFEKEKAEVYYVELEATLKERLRRNKTAHRLKHKPSKRDIEFSETHLLKDEKKYRMNSKEGEIKRKNYLKINNTKLSAKAAAKIIKKVFSF